MDPAEIGDFTRREPLPFCTLDSAHAAFIHHALWMVQALYDNSTCHRYAAYVILRRMSNMEAVDLPLTLGQQFAAARRKARKSQAELGVILGCHRTTISRWELDEDDPPFKAVVRLSELSGWPLAYFGRAAEPTPDPGPNTPDGQVIDGTGWFGRSAGERGRHTHGMYIEAYAA